MASYDDVQLMREFTNNANTLQLAGFLDEAAANVVFARKIRESIERDWDDTALAQQVLDEMDQMAAELESWDTPEQAIGFRQAVAEFGLRMGLEREGE